MKYVLIIFLILVFYSCDPGVLGYVRNNSEDTVKITVSYTHKFNADLNDTLKASFNMIKQINHNTNTILDSMIIAKKLDDTTNEFYIKSNTTVLIGSPVYGIEMVNIEKDQISNTIIFKGKNRNYKEFVKNGVITLQNKPYKRIYIIDII